MKPILTYRLVPFEGTVMFQIIDMDESHRGPGNSWFHKGIELSVCSETHPELCEKTVYLREYDKTSDFAVSRLDFKSDTARDEYMKNVRAALRAWAAAGGFTGVLCKDESVVVDAYTHTLYAGATK